MTKAKRIVRAKVIKAKVKNFPKPKEEIIVVGSKQVSNEEQPTSNYIPQAQVEAPEEPSDSIESLCKQPLSRPTEHPSVILPNPNPSVSPERAKELSAVAEAIGLKSTGFGLTLPDYIKGLKTNPEELIFAVYGVVKNIVQPVDLECIISDGSRTITGQVTRSEIEIECSLALEIEKLYFYGSTNLQKGDNIKAYILKAEKIVTQTKKVVDGKGIIEPKKHYFVERKQFRLEEIASAIEKLGNGEEVLEIYFPQVKNLLYKNL